MTQRPAITTHEAVAADLIACLERQVGSVVKGKGDVIRQAVVCLLAQGHVLIEDVPGVGKTTLARSLANSLGLAFQRIQFTSDLLPSDIVGVSIYRQASERFEYVPGPIFSNVVLADEINRASPKTQSALLEAMSERHVTIDRERHPLPEPFIVLATQNPLEYVGTFPLPESQLDRFMMSLRLGYPPREQERELLISGGVDRILADLEPVVSREDVLRLQARAEEVQVADKLADYILSLAEATRDSAQFVLGVSTRGVQNLYRATQAMALCEGRPFATPDDVQRVAVPVFAHRVLLKNGGGGLEAARTAVARVVDSVPIPV
ncbi:MAG: MoxR family ATPase [Thermoanaerobaculia bacterium]